MKTLPALLLAAGCAATAHAQFLQDLMPPDKSAVQNVGANIPARGQHAVFVDRDDAVLLYQDRRKEDQRKGDKDGNDKLCRVKLGIKTVEKFHNQNLKYKKGL